jgi:hypothetical protein
VRDLAAFHSLPPVSYDACEKKAGRVSSLTAPRRRLPFDVLYDRVRAFLERTMSPSVFL